MASGDNADCNCQNANTIFIKRCNPEDSHILVHKLVELLGDPITANLYDRQFIILNEFIEATPDGFWVKDLPFTMRLLELLIDGLEIVCLYKKPLEILLSLCALPPKLTRASETITFSRDLQEYFSFLGYLLVRLREPQLQDLIIKALHKLLVRKEPTGLGRVQLQECNKAVEKSELPVVISQLLEMVDEELYVKLLKIAWILVNISPTVCVKMVNAKAVDFLMLRLDPEWNTRSESTRFPDPPDNIVISNYELIGKLLWSLLSACKDPKELHDHSEGPSVQALKSFRYAFKAIVKQKNGEVHRNNMLGIFLMCLDTFPNLRIVQSRLTYDIGLLGAATEMGTGSTWASQVTFSANETDYNFKKMLLLTMCYCRTPDKIQALRPKRVIPALLKILTPKLSTVWHPLQHKKLISLTFHTLQVLVPKVPEEFIYYHGSLRLLMMVEYYNDETYDIGTLKDCLKSLSSIASTKNQYILDDLRVHDATAILITTCSTLLSQENLTLVIQKCLAYGFSLLELLCTDKACHSSAVNLCIKFMNRIVNPNVNDPIFDPKFLICAIDFFWEGVVWCKNNLELFVSIGGVFKLLDIIQRAIFPVKLLALGSLVDMCDDGSCVPHLVTWRKNGQTLLPMLLQLFREENFKLGVQFTPEGIIADIEAPLMGHQQWYETFYEIKDPNSSPAMIDLLGSCRPKIYALIQLLTNRHEQRAAIANERYQMYNNNALNTHDQITLLLAENFLALKLGEAWVELGKDIEKAGMRPLTVEKEMIAFLTRRLHRWAQHIKTIQERLLDEKMKNDCKDEKQLYSILRSSKLIESLKALHELDYIARTTEHMFRFVSKMTQTAELDASLRFTEGVDYHTTYMRQIKVTPVFGQMLSMQSDIINDPNEKFDIRPVSPNSDEKSEISYDISEHESIDRDVRPSNSS